MKDLNENIKKSARMILNSLPIMISIIFLVSLINSVVSKEMYLKILNNDLGVFISSIVGSISIGSPIISYIISGELIKSGISILVISAFILSWVTVGFLQIPLEIEMFGKKFAIFKLLINFILSILGAYLIYCLVKII